MKEIDIVVPARPLERISRGTRISRWNINHRARVTRKRLARRARMFATLDRYKRRRGCARSRGLGHTSPLELDHIIPRYLGGRPKRKLLFMRGARRRDWIHLYWYLWHPNIQILCRSCHARKDGKIKPPPEQSGRG